MKSADGGLERRKKLLKVRRVNNFSKDVVEDETVNALRWEKPFSIGPHI